jgi:hypothetical protein
LFSSLRLSVCCDHLLPDSAAAMTEDNAISSRTTKDQGHTEIIYFTKPFGPSVSDSDFNQVHEILKYPPANSKQQTAITVFVLHWCIDLASGDVMVIILVTCLIQSDMRRLNDKIVNWFVIDDNRTKLNYYVVLIMQLL